MIYGVIFVVVALIVYFLRRRLSLPFIVLFVGSFLLDWWGRDLANLLLGFGVGMGSARLQALVKICLLTIILIILLYKSSTDGRNKSKRIFGAAIFGLSFIIILSSSLSSLITIDTASVRISEFLMQSYRPILTVASLWAMIDLIFLRQE